MHICVFRRPQVNEKMKDFIPSESEFTFMSGIKGTLAYWNKVLFDVMTMISIISKLNKQEIADEDIQKLPYHDRWKLLNSNPVLPARHFQYQIVVFFKEIIVDEPLGKEIHNAIRVELQVRGSPHIHCFLWVLNAPTLTTDDKLECIPLFRK